MNKIDPLNKNRNKNNYLVRILSETMLKVIKNKKEFSINNLMLSENRFNFKKSLLSYVSSFLLLNRIKNMDHHIKSYGLDNIISSKNNKNKFRKTILKKTSLNIEDLNVEVEVEQTSYDDGMLHELLRLPPRPTSTQDSTASTSETSSSKGKKRMKTAAVLHYRNPKQNISTFEVGFRASLRLLKRFQVLDATMVPIPFKLSIILYMYMHVRKSISYMYAYIMGFEYDSLVLFYCS